MQRDQLIQEITSLKKERGIILPAHYYQDESIQEVADFAGDSPGLAIIYLSSSTKE